MASPVFDEEGISKNTQKIIPIYPLTYGLSQNTIRQIIENGIKDAGNINETLPQNFLEKFNLININLALKQIHFPNSFEEFKKARRRLVFEELFTMQLALLMLKNKYEESKLGIEFSNSVQMSDIINNLPFSLTNAQKKVLEEINKDMESSKPMNRLLQGDVGSRKNHSCNYFGI